MLQVSLIEINNNFRQGEHQANYKNTCYIRERPVGIFYFEGHKAQTY